MARVVDLRELDWGVDDALVGDRALVGAEVKAAQFGGPEMKPFVDKTMQDGTAEFRAAVKKAGLTAQ